MEITIEKFKEIFGEDEYNELSKLCLIISIQAQNSGRQVTEIFTSVYEEYKQEVTTDQFYNVIYLHGIKVNFTRFGNFIS